MPAATVVSLEELIALFAGDDLTAGYPTDKLAHEICRIARPVTLPDLHQTIYHGQPQDEISNRALRTMKRGFRAWVKAGRPG